MSVVGLFSGIGGFERAFSRAGFETSCLVEIDPAARAVLKARFPGVEIRKDVRELSGLPSGATVVTAGFPCQNLSMAGDKAGVRGAESGVVEKLFDLIGGSDSPAVLIENVYFMLQLDSGEAMTWLAEEFERRGYRWAYRVLDTMGFGLPQRRRRVYMLACRDMDPRTVLFADKGPSSATPPPSLRDPLGFYWTEGRSGVGLTVDGVPPIKAGSTVGIPSPPAVLFPDGAVLTPGLRACERLQGFPAGWTDVEDARVGKNPGWRMVGNAVSVPVARWVADRMRRPGPVLNFPERKIEPGDRWPNAAWNVGDGRVGVDAGDRPDPAEPRSISEFRDSSWSRLSDRAMNGFIARAEQGALRMPAGFLDALRKAERKVPKAA